MSDSSSSRLNQSPEFEKVLMKSRRVRSRISGVHRKMVRSMEKHASRTTSEDIDEDYRAPNSSRINRLERQKAMRVSAHVPETEVDDSQDVDEVVKELLSVSGLDSSLLEDPQKKREVYNFVKKNQVARAVTMRRTMKHNTVIAVAGGDGTTSTCDISSHTVAKKETTAPPPPPPPLPPPPPQPPTPSSPTIGIGIINLGKVTSVKQDVCYAKPGNCLALIQTTSCFHHTPLLVDFLEEIRMRGQMENAGLASSTSSAARRPPADAGEDRSLTATLQRGLEHIFNAVYSDDDDDESHVGNSGSDESWDEDAC